MVGTFDRRRARGRGRLVEEPVNLEMVLFLAVGFVVGYYVVSHYQKTGAVL